MYDLVIKGGTTVTPAGKNVCDIAVKGESIAALGRNLHGKREINAEGLYVMSGVIDPHVHMALPVRGDRSSDNFSSGSMAAAAGGITTLIDFTVGSHETSIPQDIEVRKDTARSSVIDYGFHGEVIGWRPDRASELAEAVSAGVTSFKFFTAYSDSGRSSSSGVLYDCFSHIASLNAMAIVHSEDDELIKFLMANLSDEEMGKMSSLAVTRPDICEGSAIDQVAYYAEVTGARAHIVHVSSALGARRLELARKRGVALTGETCPQYLLLDSSVYDEPEGHLYSASPALRTKEDNEYLWNCLRRGALEFVVTDHCPFTRKQKNWSGSFVDLPYGLPGVETLLPLVYSEGVVGGRITLEEMPRLLSSNPARLYGLENKGDLIPGYDADIVLFDPEARWTVKSEKLHMNVDFSPYEDRKITGRVVTTIARGDIIFNCGEICCSEGRGRYISRMCQ